MDWDLENDLLFEDDRINNFLQNKLQEIQVSNKKFEEMIKKRKNMFSGISQSSNINVKNFNVLLYWKKLFNGKCALGYEVQNNLNINMKLCRVFLKWNSLERLNYNIHSVTERDLICSKTVSKGVKKSTQDTESVLKDCIVIVINIPQFLDNLSYILSGHVFYKHNETDIIFDLPNVEISSLDVTNKKINEVSLQSENISDLLTVIYCSLKTDFVMILPEGSATNLNSIFEIHCFLTSFILFKSKKYFAAYKICTTFDNSLIEIDTSCDKPILNVSIYSKNDETLITFLHYLHQNIPGVIIIPKSIFQSYDIHKICGKFDKDSEINNFQTFIEKEIGIVQNFQQYLESTRNDSDMCMHLRHKLLDAEKNTDLSYLRITSYN